MSDFLSYLSWFQILLIMLMLMSGGFSIFREVVGIYNPKKAKGSNLFWRCVRITFVISAISLWVIEHHQTLALQAELDKKSSPQFRGRYGEGIAPAGPNDKDTLITFAGYVTNTGAPSIVQSWRATITLVDGRVINGHEVGPPLPETPVNLVQKDGTMRTLKGAEHWRMTGTIAPVPTGGGARGWIQFVFVGVDTSQLVDGTKLTLFFSDINGKEWSIDNRLSPESQDLLNPGTVQRPDMAHPQ